MNTIPVLSGGSGMAPKGAIACDNKSSSPHSLHKMSLQFMPRGRANMLFNISIHLPPQHILIGLNDMTIYSVG